MATLKTLFRNIGLIFRNGRSGKPSSTKSHDLTQAFAAQQALVGSHSSWDPLGQIFSVQSAIQEAQAALTRASLLMQERIIKPSLGLPGDPLAEQLLSAMTSAPRPITPASETSSNHKSAAMTPGSGKKLRLVSDRSQEGTQTKPLPTSNESTGGVE